MECHSGRLAGNASQSKDLVLSVGIVLSDSPITAGHTSETTLRPYQPLTYGSHSEGMNSPLLGFILMFIFL